jgi:hypothetical protein
MLSSKAQSLHRAPPLSWENEKQIGEEEVIDKMTMLTIKVWNLADCIEDDQQ